MKKIEKYIIAVITLIAIGAIGTAVYFGLNKTKDDNKEISNTKETVEKNENNKISYKTLEGIYKGTTSSFSDTLILWEEGLFKFETIDQTGSNYNGCLGSYTIVDKEITLYCLFDTSESENLVLTNASYGININSDLSLSWGFDRLIKEQITEDDLVQGKYYGPSPSFWEIMVNNCKNKNNCITIPNDWYEN